MLSRSGPKEMLLLPIAMPMNASTNAIPTRMDLIPMLNISAFGNCNSPGNPMNWKMAGHVAVFFQSSCMPIHVMPWDPVATKIKVGGNPAMLEMSKSMCVWAGSIMVDKPGLTNVEAE